MQDIILVRFVLLCSMLFDYLLCILIAMLLVSGVQCSVDWLGSSHFLRLHKKAFVMILENNRWPLKMHLRLCAGAWHIWQFLFSYFNLYCNKKDAVRSFRSLVFFCLFFFFGCCFVLALHCLKRVTQWLSDFRKLRNDFSLYKMSYVIICKGRQFIGNDCENFSQCIWTNPACLSVRYLLF